MAQQWSEESLEIVVDDRRRQPRFPLNHVREIRQHPQADPTPAELMAKLVDISDGGVGVETAAPLQAGSFVTIHGELHSTRFCVGLQGKVRVAHCQHREGGRFQVGLAFEGAFCRNIHCDHHIGSDPVGADGLPIPAQTFVVGGDPGSGHPETRIPSHLWGNLYVVAAEEDEAGDMLDSVAAACEPAASAN